MRLCPSYLMRGMPEAARKEPLPVLFFLWEAWLPGLELGVAPAGAGVLVVPARPLGHELADARDECELRFDTLDGVEFLLKLPGEEPEACIPAGWVVGDEPVVDEPGDADAPAGVPLLAAGQLELDDDPRPPATLGSGRGLLLPLQFSHQRPPGRAWRGWLRSVSRRDGRRSRSGPRSCP